MTPTLEQAVAEIRDEAIDPAVIEAAAARVWARLSVASAPGNGASSVIRNCADFQALIPDYRAGRLSDARAMLVQDHLHSASPAATFSKASVVAMPAAADGPTASITPPAGPWRPTVLLAAGAYRLVYRESVRRAHRPRHRADRSTARCTRSPPTASVPILAGQDLPGDVELRTAKDSDAVLHLADGSQVEVRERSSLYTTRRRPRSHRPPGARQRHRAGRAPAQRPSLCGYR